jgi:hypothetical protein
MDYTLLLFVMNGFALSSGNEDRRFGAHHRELIDQSRHPDDKNKGA